MADMLLIPRHFLGLLVLLALGTMHTAAEPEATCANFWFSFGCHSYKYVAERMTWADAELNCLSQNANLVSIHSIEEHNFVRALIKNCDPQDGRTWNGLSDLHKEGSWMWSDGSKVNFTLWLAGEPNNQNGDENCGQTNHDVPPHTWNDRKCSLPYPTVCKSRRVCA